MSWQPAPVIATQRRVSIPATVVISLGIVAIALWLFVLDFAGTDDLGAFSFADLRRRADAVGLTGLPGAWYAWIAYLSAALAVIFAIVTLIPGPSQAAMRSVAVTVSVAGIVIAFIALGDGRRGIELGDRSVGFWVGMGGFLLLAVGSLIRPSPVVTVLPAVQATTWNAAPAATAWPAEQVASQWSQAPAGAAPAADPWSVAAPGAPVATPAVAAGWHPDPTGRNEQRWWDGQAWSAHVVRGGLQTTDPL